MHQQIIQFIVEDLHQGRTDLDISPEDDLLMAGLLESLGVLQLVQFLENTFDLKIPPQDMTIENFQTVEAMVTYIKSKRVVSGH